LPPKRAPSITKRSEKATTGFTEDSLCGRPISTFPAIPAGDAGRRPTAKTPS
jgi:hypothetical protein